jgi:hypothetical protein
VHLTIESREQFVGNGERVGGILSSHSIFAGGTGRAGVGSYNSYGRTWVQHSWGTTGGVTGNMSSHQ